MKNTVTIILVAALVAFSAYFTVMKVNENAGFMVPEIGVKEPVREAGPALVKGRAIKAEKRAAVTVAETSTEKIEAEALHDEKVLPAAEPADVPEGDVRHVETIEPAAVATADEEAGETELMAGEMFIEADDKDTLLSDIQEIITAAEEAAMVKEAKVEGPFASKHAEEALPSRVEAPEEGSGEGTEALRAEEGVEEAEGEVQQGEETLPQEAENGIPDEDIFLTEGITGEAVEGATPDAASGTAGETGEVPETLLADEETAEPVKDTFPAEAEEAAGQADENAAVSDAETVTEVTVEDAVPVAEAKRTVHMPAEEPAGDARPAEGTLPAAEEPPAAEKTEETAAAPVEEVIPAAAVEVPAEGELLEGSEKEPMNASADVPYTEEKERLETLLEEEAAAEPHADGLVAVTKEMEAAAPAEEVSQKHDNAALPDMTVTGEPAEGVLPAIALKPAADTVEVLETLLADEEQAEPVKDAFPAEAGEADGQADEKAAVSDAETVTEVTVEDIVPVAAEERAVDVPAEDIAEEPAGDARPAEGTLPAAEEPPAAEKTEETAAAPVEEVIPAAIDVPAGGELIEGVVQEPQGAAVESPGAEAEEAPDALPAAGAAEAPEEEAAKGTETAPAEVSVAEPAVDEQPVEETLPPADESPAAEETENITAEPVEGAMPSAAEVEVPADSAEGEAFEEMLPAEAPSMEAEEKAAPLKLTHESDELLVGAEKRIAVLEFDNFTDDMNALKRVMPGLKKRLKAKGLSVVGEGRVSDFLCEEKIRYTSYLPKEILRKVRNNFRVGTVLAGAVVSMSSNENPQVGILARSIDASSGVIVWADYVSFSGDDFATVLGLGRVKNIDELIARSLDRLFESFSTAPVQVRNESVYRIAVMPFQNKSRFRNAGVITMHMFLVELLKNEKFEPVEYGQLRKLIVDLRVRSKGELEYRNLEALSEALNVGGVVLGTVEKYSAGIDESLPPKVAVNARLLDARNNRILWYNSHESNGEKGIIAFEWGNHRSVDKVANRVVVELVERMNAAILQY